ncbi:MAG: hypothetical protein MZU95_06520 [Desulfomicrobium escambiense]|nr:hypothetical protein [Desulfomicrobium escambiense]
MVAFLHANITNADLEVGNDLTRYRIINFMYGYTYDAVSAANPNPVAKREWLLGDIIHSEPKIIDYFDDSGTLEPPVHRRGRQRRHAPRVYRCGRNHRRRAVIRPETRSLPLFRRISSGDSRSSAYRTLTSTRWTAPLLSYRSNTTRTVSGTDHYVKTLVFGERAGGRSYWALDVTAPDPSTWKVKWHIEGGASGVTEFQELGYTWSKPFFTGLKT